MYRVFEYKVSPLQRYPYARDTLSTETLVHCTLYIVHCICRMHSMHSCLRGKID